MFWPDVVELKEFYSGSLGQVSCRVIRRAVKNFWGEGKYESVIGIGYAAPYLTPFQDDARLTAAFMPAQQGAIAWPVMQASRTIMTLEDELPLADNSIERVIIAHALENTSHAEQLMAEVWRVLMPSGKVLAIVPNRSGLWSHYENNPFAYGRPYSKRMIERIFSEHMFEVTGIEPCLFNLPSHKRYVLRATDFMENIGSKFLRPMGGVLVVAAEKQVYSIKPVKAAKRVGKYVYIPATAQTA